MILTIHFANGRDALSFYSPDSPWNLEIGTNPAVDPASRVYLESIHGPFGSNPLHFTIPLYRITGEEPRIGIQIKKYFSSVQNNGLQLTITKNTSVSLPWPPDAMAAAGTDGNLVIWNSRTGDEWGFWKAGQQNGSWQATNGYHYNTHWSAIPPDGFRSRGAGLPYLAGLVLREEIDRGHIDHAIAFGINYPADWYVFPATKTDSTRKDPRLLPMGSRLQLNPDLGEKDFDRWKLSRAGKIIARALQKYGMILVSGSGHPKIYVESENTARWSGMLTKNTVKNIPFTAFRLLSLETPSRPAAVEKISVQHENGGNMISWTVSPAANRYSIYRKADDKYFLLASDVTECAYFDPMGQTATEYRIIAINHNGVSESLSIH